MAKFLDEVSVSGAVSRLGTATCESRVCDYLIYKRALSIELASDASTDAVTTGMTNEAFMAALREWTAIAAEGEAARDNPFFNPFGSNRRTGFRGPKFPSNGPSVTANQWIASSNTSPLVPVDGTRPRQMKIVPRTEAEYEQFFLLSASLEATRPQLLDAAVWLFRREDVEPESGDADPEQALVDRLVAECGITQAEIAGIFSTASDGRPVQFADAVADPSSYLPASPQKPKQGRSGSSDPPQDQSEAVAGVVEFIAQSGFSFEPWQSAAFLAAARSKPFIILAGISGTGKTRLPKLIAGATESEITRVPVRPDWTNGDDLLGYRDLGGQFVEGSLLVAAKKAMEAPERHHFFLLDEMNVARVEYYLADVLSHMEDRGEDGSTAPLVPNAGGDWGEVRLPINMTIVGTVNMDETTFGFSRKVLDRAFVLEFSEVDLSAAQEIGDPSSSPWSLEQWDRNGPPVSYSDIASDESVVTAVEALIDLNESLAIAQLQVGFRTRDEVARFCRAATSAPEMFVASDGAPVDPLDIALTMKLLPRIHGGGAPVQQVLEGLKLWLARSAENGRSFPMFEARLEMMENRLVSSGVTSFWL